VNILPWPNNYQILKFVVQKWVRPIKNGVIVIDPPCFMQNGKIHFMVDMSLNVKHFNVFYYKEIIYQFLSAFSSVLSGRITSFKVSTITGSYNGRAKIKKVADSTNIDVLVQQITENISMKEGVVKEWVTILVREN